MRIDLRIVADCLICLKSDNSDVMRVASVADFLVELVWHSSNFGSGPLNASKSAMDQRQVSDRWERGDP
jgi:hypothetical protein